MKPVDHRLVLRYDSRSLNATSMMVRNRLPWLLLLVPALAFAQPPDADERVRELLAPGAEPADVHRDPDLFRAFVLAHRGDDADVAGTRQVLEAVAARHPSLREAWFGLGFLGIVTGDWELAEKGANRALDASPGWGLGLNLLGVSMLERGRLAEAGRLLLEAARSGPDLPFPYTNLFRLARAAGNCDAIEQAVSAAVATADDGNAPTVRNAIRQAAWIEFGVLEEEGPNRLSATCLDKVAGLIQEPALQAAVLTALATSGDDAQDFLPRFEAVLQAAREARDPTLLAEVLGRKCDLLEAAGLQGEGAACQAELASVALAAGDAWMAYGALLSACVHEDSVREAACGCTIRLSRLLEAEGGVGAALAALARGDCRHAQQAERAAQGEWAVARKRLCALQGESGDARIPSFLADIEEHLGLHDEAIRTRRTSLARFLANPDSDPGRIYLERESLVAHLGTIRRHPEALEEARLLVEDYERLEGKVLAQYRHEVMTLVDPGTCSPVSREVRDLKLRMLAVQGEPLDVAESQVDRVACLRIAGMEAEAADAVGKARTAFSKVRPDWSDPRYAEVGCDIARRAGNGPEAVTACEHFLAAARGTNRAFKIAMAVSDLADAVESTGDIERWERLSVEAAERFLALDQEALAGSIWVQLASSRMRRGDAVGAERAAVEALKLPLDGSSRIWAGMTQVEALDGQGRQVDARKRFVEITRFAGTDPVLWDQILGSAGASPDVELKRLAFARFSLVRDKVRFPSDLSLVAQARVLSLEAHATGRFVDGLDKLKSLLRGIGNGHRLPKTVRLLAKQLATAAGDMTMIQALDAMACDDGEGPCEPGMAIMGRISSALLESRGLGVMVRRGTFPSRGELLDALRSDLLPVLGGGWSDESVAAILSEPGASPITSRYRAALQLAMWQPERALGLVDEALALLAQDAPVSARLPLVLLAGSALANLDRRAEAVERFRAAEGLARSQPDAPHRERDLMMVASAATQSGVCPEFAPLRAEVSQSYSGARRGWAWVSLRMDDIRCRLEGQASQDVARLDADLQEFETLAPQLSAMGFDVMDVMMRVMFAARLESTARTGDAISVLRKAVEGVERVVTSTPDPASHARMFQGLGRIPFDFCILLLFQRGEPGDAEEALRLSERTRSIELLNDLGRKGIRVAAAGLPREVLDREGEFLGRLALARAESSRIGLETPWDVAGMEAAEARARAADRDLREFADQVWQAHPLYASVRFPRPLDLGAVPLRPDELLVEYRVLPTSQLVVWLVDADPGTGRSRILFAVKRPVAQETLDQVGRVRAWLSRPLRDRRDAMQPLTGTEDLVKSLLPDLLAHADPVRHRRLLVVSDDLMQGIPLEVFDLAPVGGCVGPDTHAGNHLSDCFGVEYQPSIATLSMARTLPAPQPKAGRLLAIGDPVFAADDPRLASHGNTGSGAGTTSCVPARLPSTATLATAAMSSLCPRGEDRRGCKVLLGPAAVEDAWAKALAEGFRVIHVSTHTGIAGVEDSCAEASGEGEPALLLSLAVPGAGDNRLARSEIMGLDLAGTELAVLAGCASAGGNDAPSEGIAGLAAAFLRAGTRQVIGSLWPVDELGTTALMSAFYAAYAETGDAAESLARARRAMRADPRWDAPFFWAGFVLFGASPAGPTR